MRKKQMISVLSALLFCLSGCGGIAESPPDYISLQSNDFEQTEELSEAANTNNLEMSAAQNVPENITGIYVYDDGSNLFIDKNSDGSYAVSLELFRLTCIEDFVGIYESNILTVTGTDAAGNSITAEILFSDRTAVFTFTYSTWSDLPKGTQYIFTHVYDSENDIG